MRGDNFKKAKALIGEALTRDKSQGTGWLVAAKVEEKQGNDGLVALILQRGLECAPNHAPLYCALAELEIRRGKIQVVSKTCRRFVLLFLRCDSENNVDLYLHIKRQENY